MGQKVHPTGFRLGISTEYTLRSGTQAIQGLLYLSFGGLPYP